MNDGRWTLLLIDFQKNTTKTRLYYLASKMNRILRCDWLPERARWRYLAKSGLPAVSRKLIVLISV